MFIVGAEVLEGWNYYNDASIFATSYNQYRFSGSGTNSCRIGEFKIKGLELLDENSSTKTCDIKVVLNDGITTTTTTVAGSSVIYDASVTSISPRWGTVKGNTLITLTGTNFPQVSASNYHIKFDGKECTSVTVVSATQVTCVTAPRPGLYGAPTIEIKVDNYGSVNTGDEIFRYVSLWSDPDTWGGEFIPIADESVYIPAGLHLLVDVDSTPVLKAVLVEGSLIFPSVDNNLNH